MSKKKLIIAEPEGFSNEAIDILSKIMDIELIELKEDDLPQVFQNYDFIWLRLGFKISKDLLCNPKRKIAAIICPATGLDHIDLKTCKELGIKVLSLKGENEFLKEIRATAELTIGLTLSILRKIPNAVLSVKNKEWNRDSFKGSEVFNKNIGIVGMGRLGKIVADYFIALGANVSGYDIKKFKINGVKNTESIKELVSISDIISIHIDYNESNHHLFDKNLFSHFKEKSILINTSRGGIVDSNALIYSLKSKRLSGAALDVIEDEFNFPKSSLIKYAQNNDNIIITPHIGGNTKESFNKTEIFLAKKLSKLANINV